MPEPKMPLFENSPVRGCCSLCDFRQGPFHFECRPTGRNGKLQAWPICKSCRHLVEVATIDINADRAVLLAHRFFIACIFRPDLAEGRYAHSADSAPSRARFGHYNLTVKAF